MLAFVSHLTRQIAVSRALFGPGARTKAVLDHIRKEIEEVEAARSESKVDEEFSPRAEEWVDLVILSVDGLTRQLWDEFPDADADVIAEMAVEMIAGKQGRNEKRSWPDWRKADPDKAIEHDRSEE